MQSSPTRSNQLEDSSLQANHTWKGTNFVDNQNKQQFCNQCPRSLIVSIYRNIGVVYLVCEQGEERVRDLYILYIIKMLDVYSVYY